MPAGDRPLERLLEDLAATAALPRERARSLPPPFYWREDVFRLEVERIFEKDWLCVGRSEALEEAGSWLKVDVVGEPLVVVRDRSGTLRALSRVCRHRAMDILAGEGERKGRADVLRCPYHLWSYDLDGALRTAPLAKDNPGFVASRCRLPEFPLAGWQGFLFVALDRGVAPLAPRMQRLGRHLEGFDLSDWRTAATLSWGEVPVNWKVALENGAEFYHHLGAHRTTLQPLWPAGLVKFEDEDSDEYVVGRMRVAPDAAVVADDGHPVQPILLPPVPGLSRDQRAETLVVVVFPLFLMALGPDAAIWFEWYPTRSESHRLDIHLLVPPASLGAPGFEAAVAQMVEGIRQVQAEDAAANAGVQRGLRSRAAAQGPLVAMESTIHQFQRYLARRLLPERMATAGRRR